jgi:blue copper oxidase
MFTRRHLMMAAAAFGLSGRAQADTVGQCRPPLPIPDLQDARKMGGALSLVAAPRRHRFAPNLPEVATYGYSAPFLGPVLRVRSGEQVRIAVENRLAMETTAHWHGLLVPSWLDGGPHSVISPGQTWRVALNVAQPEATAWYHAHPHHDTGRQVYMGLAGMMIVEDGTGERLGLPRRYGIDDLPLILQDRLFDASGELNFTQFSRERILGTRGDSLIVNGAISPMVRVPSGLVRLRLLNAANARNFHLGFEDGREFHVIASDGGYLAAPVALRALTIAPGERFEVLVAFSESGPTVLHTLADPPEAFVGAPGLGSITSRGPGGERKSAAGALLHFEVDPLLPPSQALLPESLVPLAAPDPSAALLRRKVTLDMWPGMGGHVGMAGGDMGPGGRIGRPGSGPAMGINGKPFDMHRIDFTPKLGSTEIWEVHPFLMPHPFHVHGATLRVLSVNGVPPEAHLAGEKDTVLLEHPAELLVSFRQPATKHHPFMIHCHILDHEDAGMMGQYITT